MIKYYSVITIAFGVEVSEFGVEVSIPVDQSLHTVVQIGFTVQYNNVHTS